MLEVFDPGVVQAIEAKQEAKSLQEMNAISYDEAVLQTQEGVSSDVSDQIEGGGDDPIQNLLNQKDEIYKKLERAKTQVDSLQAAGNPVAYFVALQERQSALEEMKAFLEKGETDVKGFPRKDRREWRNRYAAKWNNLLRAIETKVIENKKALEGYTGPNVETGDTTDLVQNKDFVEMFPEGMFQGETMKDFLASNEKYSKYLELKKKAEEEKDAELKAKLKEEADRLFGEIDANMRGEIIGQSNLLIHTIEDFAKTHLTDQEDSTFDEDLAVLKDKESSLDDKIKSAERITKLMKQYLLYVGGVDVNSGNKKYLALRESDDVIRTEFEAYMQIDGKDSTQMMTFYGEPASNDINEVQLVMIENEFTNKEGEELTNDHFNKTQLELPFYAQLRALFEKRTKEFKAELNKFEQEALRVVRQLHNVVVGLKAYDKMEGNLKK